MLFVDYNQNARDHTIASAYSVRGVPEATVSTPIGWDEIDDVDPQEFTIATVPGRFARLGDLHKGIDEAPTRWKHCWSGRTATASTKSLRRGQRPVGPARDVHHGKVVHGPEQALTARELTEGCRSSRST